MDKKKIELIVTGVLILVFIFAVVNAFKPRRQRSRPSPEAVKVKKAKEAIVPLPKEVKSSFPSASPQLLSLQKERAELDWGRDPFSKAVRKEFYSGTSLVLKGISLGREGRGYALINDEVVTVGDTISGYQVMEVEKNRVFLKKEEESFYLVLPEE
jgi:hypothetical protein